MGSFRCGKCNAWTQFQPKHLCGTASHISLPCRASLCLQPKPHCHRSKSRDQSSASSSNGTATGFGGTLQSLDKDRHQPLFLSLHLLRCGAFGVRLYMMGPPQAAQVKRHVCPLGIMVVHNHQQYYGQSLDFRAYPSSQASLRFIKACRPIPPLRRSCVAHPLSYGRHVPNEDGRIINLLEDFNGQVGTALRFFRP